MKLAPLIPETIRRMETMINETKLLEYLDKGKKHHLYIKNFNVWAAAICRDAIYKPGEICDMYEKYKCNDSHITTLIIHCMKAKGWIT